MDQIRSSLGNDVTLSVDFRNMMKNRKPSEAVSNETSLTTTMADSLKDLKYVKIIIIKYLHQLTVILFQR